MSVKVPSYKRLQDILTVLEGLQRVAYVASKQNGEALGETWKKYSKNKPFKDTIQDLRNQGLRSKNIPHIDPLELTRRAIFIGENFITFSSAASHKVTEDLLLNIIRKSTKNILMECLLPQLVRKTLWMMLNTMNVMTNM